ncbi:MAG: WecB/TagA/CpsF family glycosyltransferase, partial [Raineya sp.]|nr:WecB/TagA/CpsF family glycosyltransferase [Raineya sp.]
GTFCPPFREMTEKEIQDLAQKIQVSSADVVWIGLSTPKQEKFAYRLARFVNCHFIITVGAAFDFHTDRVKQAPRWIQNIGLEWFFRLMMEPKRLYKRYLHIVPKFIYLNFLEFLNLRKV